jgi:hypothetical protein
MDLPRRMSHGLVTSKAFRSPDACLGREDYSANTPSAASPLLG